MQSYRRATMPLNNKPVLYRYEYRGNLSLNGKRINNRFDSFEDHRMSYVVSKWILCIHKSIQILNIDAIIEND